MSILTAQANTSSSRSKELYGIFFNNQGTAVQLNIINARKKSTSISTISAAKIELAVLHDGDELRVYSTSEDMLSGRLLSTFKVPLNRASEYFESSTRTFYFRIIGSRLMILKPVELTVQERAQVKTYKRQVSKYWRF